MCWVPGSICLDISMIRYGVVALALNAGDLKTPGESLDNFVRLILASKNIQVEKTHRCFCGKTSTPFPDAIKRPL